MSTIPTAVYIDTIHDTVNSIPEDTAYVGGYVTGTQDIQWTAGDWGRFPHSVKSRIYQGYGAVPSLSGFDEIDIEPGGVSPETAAELVRSRVMSGIQWTTLYGTDDSIRITNGLIQAMGANIWIGHVNVRLANWNLNATQAAALIGSYIHGATCIGVQWASPSSNPDTMVPGTNVPLKIANVDLNVVDAYWQPSGGFSRPVIPPPPPGTPTQVGTLVILPDGGVKRVTSTDGGISWQ